MKYAWINQHKQRFPITISCHALGVSRSGFYAWLHRKPSLKSIADAALLREVRRVHRLGRENFGTRKIYSTLKAEGFEGGRDRIARL